MSLQVVLLNWFSVWGLRDIGPGVRRLGLDFFGLYIAYGFRVKRLGRKGLGVMTRILLVQFFSVNTARKMCSHSPSPSYTQDALSLSSRWTPLRRYPLNLNHKPSTRNSKP